MDKQEISYALLEASLGNSIDGFLDRLLADVRADYSQSRNMSTEQMNFLKKQISSIIDIEVDSIMNNINGNRDNVHEDNDILKLNESKNLKLEVKSIQKVPEKNIIKEESFPKKNQNNDEMSELEIALIISREDFLENSALEKKQEVYTKPIKLNNKVTENSIINKSMSGGSQLLESLMKEVTYSETIEKPEIFSQQQNRLIYGKQSEKIPASDLEKIEANRKDKEIAESKVINSNNEIRNQFSSVRKVAQNYESATDKSLMRKRKEEKKIQEKRQELLQIELENLNIQRRILESIKDCINGYDLKRYTKQSMRRIKLYIDCYNALSVPRVKFQNFLERDDNLTVNDISHIVLELCSLLKKFDKEFIPLVFSYVRPHVEEISRISLEYPKMFLFNKEEHVIDETVNDLHKVFLSEFERVQIRGDGNCIWNSISVAMFGDYSFMESLRVLTAATLIKNKKYFESHLNEQRVKFGYRHGLTFEELIDASIELSVWGDEYHLIALSLALHRPIISYGPFSHIPNLSEDMSYEELKTEYESENQINHMLYVGDSDEKENIPICIYYNGENHYCAILPRRRNVEPLIPKTQLFDYIINREKAQIQKNDAKANTVGHKFSGSVLIEEDNEVIPKIREKENRNKIIANYELPNDRVNNHSN